MTSLIYQIAVALKARLLEPVTPTSPDGVSVAPGLDRLRDWNRQPPGELDAGM